MKKRVMSVFLCFMICLSFVPASAFAEGEHVHDSECGYVEAVAGSPCTHECGEDCSPCTHEHDAECGYTAAVEGAPCTYAEQEENKPVEEQPKDETPKADEAVAEMQAKVDDLPAAETVASMSTEQKTELSEKLDALCEAYYDGLSETQQAQITGFDKLEKLYAALGAYEVNLSSNEYIDGYGIRYELHDDGTATVIDGRSAAPENGILYIETIYVNDVPYAVTEIGDGAFQANHNLVLVYFPCVTVIGISAFYYDLNLIGVDATSVTEIKACAFQYCGFLGYSSAVNFPEAITIGEEAFSGCQVIRELKLPKATTIGEKALFRVGTSHLINHNLTLDEKWHTADDGPVLGDDGFYHFRQGMFNNVTYVHNHSFASAWTVTDDGYHYHECTSAGHSDSCRTAEGSAYSEHSYGTDGAAEFTCTVCGFLDESRKPAVPYIDYTSGTAATETCTSYELVNDTTTAFEDGKWYVVNGTVHINSRISFSGTANLILKDGAALTVAKGIRVAADNTLNIYAQSAGSGTLNATGDFQNAAIGGNSGACGTVNIHGGIITATGTEYGAGIGGGEGGNGGKITIYSGSVAATGGNMAAGIGGGTNGSCGSVTISGGTVTADGRFGGAGIGGGFKGNGGTISISGGTVTANGSDNGAGVGKGDSGSDDGTLTLGGGVTFSAGPSAGDITVTGDNSNAGDAFGKKYFITSYTPLHSHNWSADWSHNDDAHWHACTAEGCDITDYSSCGEEGSAYGTHSYNAKYTCICGAKKPVDYVYYENGEQKNGICADYEIISAGTTQFEDGKWYVFPGLAKKGENGSSYPGGTVTVNGTSNLILLDGKELYLGYYGLVVPESSTLNIYGQSGNTGKLTVHGAIGAAGIGGSSGSSCGTVNIHGGDITAEGNYYGAGIGGGRYGNGGNITIYGGSVTAKGAYNSAGIGGGDGGNGGNVTIYGGTVNATGSLTGSSGGPGIGGSQGKDQGTLILGTDVTFGAGENADNITEWKNLENARTMNYFQSPFTAPAHTHSFSFSASQNKAIATCANTDGACQLDEDGKHTVTLTLTANNSTYTGSAYNGASTDDATVKFTETTGASLGEIQYFNDGTALTAAPVNSGSYTAKVTVTKGEASATAEAAFTIAKAAATITTNPTAAAITYGQALSASALTGGTASVPGSFAWDNGSTVPAVADSGVTAYNVKFTPTDASNYMEATVQITLTVNKADYTDAVKTASGTLSAKSGQAVEITLPAVPTGAAYGEVTNGNTDFFTVSTIANGKVTVTSAKDWDSQTETADKTFTVAVTPDANHNGYNITVTVKPAFHNHSWSGEWAHNETGHWHACTAADCNITDYSACGESGAAYAVHSFNGNTCSACGYVKGGVYTIIEGANSEWMKGSTSGMLIASDAPFSKFTGVKVDGNVVAGSNYTAVEGSTRVTFKPAYLETLSVGKHAVDIVSSDGTASTEFMIKSSVVPPVHYTVYFNMRGHGQQVASQTVEAGGKAVRPSDPRASGWTFAGWYADADCTVGFNFNTPINADTVVYAKWIPYNPFSPKTGDTANLILWASLLAGSAIGIAGAGIFMKKKKH